MTGSEVMARNREKENIPSEFCQIYWGWSKLKKSNLAWISPMKSYLMQANVRFTASTVSVLFRENKQWWKRENKCCSRVVIFAAHHHWTKPDLRFCAGLNPARRVSEIQDGGYLWQWSWLEIRLNAFRRSIISQKKIIIITLSSLPRLGLRHPWAV